MKKENRLEDTTSQYGQSAMLRENLLIYLMALAILPPDERH